MEMAEKREKEDGRLACIRAVLTERGNCTSRRVFAFQVSFASSPLLSLLSTSLASRHVSTERI